MSSSPTTPRKQLLATLILGALIALALTACATSPTTPHGVRQAHAPAETISLFSITPADEEQHIEFFPSQMFSNDSTLPQRLVGRTRQTRDTEITLNANETIRLRPTNALTEPLSASAQISGFQGKWSPCETPNGDPPISRFQAIVQSGGPGTSGVGSANEREFEIDIFGTVATRDDDVTMMGIGSRARTRTPRISTVTPGTITSVWTNNIVPGTTIPGLPAAATEVRIDAAIVMSGFDELNATNTKALCIQIVDDDGQPITRTNEAIGNGSTTRELTVDSELGYIILITFTTAAGPRYLEWSGNIQLNNLGQPADGAIAAYASTNPIREGGRELAYDMQQRASMMLIRYADKGQD